MDERNHLIAVELSHPGERLDVYLRTCFPAVSRGTFKRLIEEAHAGGCSFDGSEHGGLILPDVSEDSTKKKGDERRPSFTTSSGIPVKRVYTEADRAGADATRDLGLPGAHPFTRGVQETMYRSRLSCAALQRQ